MELQLVTGKLALIAKDKGFIPEKGGFYFRTYEPLGYCQLGSVNGKKCLDKEDKHHAFLPTQALLQKWLREEHKIHISVICVPNGYKWNILMETDYQPDGMENKTYEEALEYALIAALSLVK